MHQITNSKEGIDSKQIEFLLNAYFAVFSKQVFLASKHFTVFFAKQNSIVTITNTVWDENVRIPLHDPNSTLQLCPGSKPLDISGSTHQVPSEDDPKISYFSRQELINVILTHNSVSATFSSS